MAEVLPLMDREPESLIGESGATAGETHARLNQLLSRLIVELRRLGACIATQRERLLRMQLIESQLAKTRQKLTEVQSSPAKETQVQVRDGQLFDSCHQPFWDEVWF